MYDPRSVSASSLAVTGVTSAIMEKNHMAIVKQRLRDSIEALTEEQAIRTLQLVQYLLHTERGSSFAEIIPPPAGAAVFAEFDPLVVPGQPVSELLIADRR